MDEELSRQLAISSFRFELKFEDIHLILITGRRGIGKTQLAHYLVDQFRKVGRDPVVLDGDFVTELPLFDLNHPYIVVGQLIGRIAEEVILNANVIVNAEVVKFDRSLSYYGPDTD